MNNKDVNKKFFLACELLASKVNEQLFDNSRKWYWVGNVVGGMCDFEDADYLSPEDMCLIIDKGVTYDSYEEWKYANIDNSDKGYINLRSWLRGARHDMIKPKKKFFEWICVDDELPPFDESVLCCNRADPDDIFFCHRSNNPHVQTGANGWCFYGNGNITHWMRIKQINEQGR